MRPRRIPPAKRWPALGLLALVLAAAPAAARHRFAPWIDGTAAEPGMQVQRYDADTFVVRQSVRTNFEAPFLYLLFGRERAILFDTGAGGLAVRPAIDAIVAAWCARHHRASIPLVVAHSHGHGDHHRGDAEFAARPDTVVVGLDAAAVARFFGIADWPRSAARFDLGGRVLDIIAAPGHEPAHIVVYDARTRLLLTGDTLYPGRLYFPADRFGEYRDSVDRIASFARAHRVRWVLGAHIEMTAVPGIDYPRAAPSHPREHRLDLPPSALDELSAAVHRMGDRPGRAFRPDFIVTPLPPGG